MSTAGPKPGVVLDANVLYPPLLRDVLLSVAAAGMYRVIWTSEILEEVERNLVGHLGSGTAHLA